MTSDNELTRLRTPFDGEANAWIGGTAAAIHWFKPDCSLLPYARCILRKHKTGELRDSPAFAALLKATHEDCAGKVLTELRTDPRSIGEISPRCAATMRGLLAAVKAALEIRETSWKPGRSLSDVAKAKLKEAFDNYAVAWHLGPGMGDVRIPNPTGFRDPPPAQIAMESVAGIELTTGNAPAWLAVHRLIDFLLYANDPAPDPAQPHGHAANPVIARVLFDGRDGEVLDVLASIQTVGPAAWYIDPVALGLTTLDKDFVESLRWAWRACSTPMPNARLPAIRLQPSFAGILAVDGPSAGTMAACAMFAAATGTQLDTDASVSAALKPPDGRTLDDGQPIALSEIELGDVGGLEKKLAAAGNKKVTRVVVTAENKREAEDRRWNQVGTRMIELIPRSTLDATFQAVTGNAQIEKVLERYCDHVVDRWVAARQDEKNVDYLAHFLPPSFSKKVRDGKVRDQRETDDLSRRGEQIAEAYEQVSDPDAGEDTWFQELFLFRRLVVTEDAGAGKSIFTRRAVAWCASKPGRTRLFDGHPCLPYRWERVNTDWPGSAQGYVDDLQTAIEPFCADGVAADKVVEYAFQNGRVVLFCDGFDQLSGENATGQRLARKQLMPKLQTLYPNSKIDLTRLIVTSRAAAYEERKADFPGWQLCKINGFPPIDQLRYLADLIDACVADVGLMGGLADTWREWRLSGTYPRRPRRDESLSADEFARLVLSAPGVFGTIYGSVEQLLRVPAILAFVRTLCEKGKPFPRFANRADLYFQATEALLDRNVQLESDRSPIAQRILGCRVELREILSAVAFQMMVDDSHSYVVQGEGALCNLATSVKTLITSSDVSGKWRELWHLVGELAGFSSHLVVEQKSKAYFGWKHKGMMEFYCGLFLAKNSTSDWPHRLVRNGVAVRLTDILAQPGWEWPGQFAIELTAAGDPSARAWPNATILEGTVNALFGRPKDLPRPTELMYLAWEHRSTLPGFQRTLAAYRRQFLEVLSGAGPISEPPPAGIADDAFRLQRAQRAAELIHEAHLRPYLSRALRDDNMQLPPGETLETWLAQIKPKPERAAYCLCSDQAKNGNAGQLTFFMGAGPDDVDAYEDEKWSDSDTWKKLPPVPAFHIAACCVTREQYRLFDAVREKSDLGGDYGKDRRAPNGDSPITHVNWFDAFCFALWLGDGYRLPSEVEWEGAAWGGIDRASEEHRNAVIGVWPYNKSFSTNDVNHDGNHPLEGTQPSSYPGRTLPVCWDEARRAAGLIAPAPDALPGPYTANGFGLWQMNGNVWEWCEDWYSDYDAALAATLRGPSTGSGRVVRGGTWRDNARDCRSAGRYRNSPGYRHYFLGFRVALSSIQRDQEIQ